MPTSFADATGGEKAACVRLTPGVRDVLAESYDCGKHRVVCVDGASGEFFAARDKKQKATLARPGRPQITANAGNQVLMRVFADLGCELEMERLTFSTQDVKVLDTRTAQPGAKDEDFASKAAQKKVEEALVALQELSLQLKTDSERNVDKLQAAVEATTRAVEKVNAGLASRPGVRAASVDESTKDLETAKKALNELKGVQNGAVEQAVVRASETISAAAAAIDAAKIDPTKARLERVSAGNGQPVWIREFAYVLPNDEEIQFVNVTASSTQVIGENEGRKTWSEWPQATAQYSVLHGKYYWDFGILLAAVVKGKREYGENAAGLIQEPEQDLVLKSLLSATVYFNGRHRSQGFAKWGSLGMQVAVNSDVTKIADVFAFGGVFEPYNGLALTGGVMVLKLQDLRRGYAVGDMAPANDSHLMEEYGVRGYLGVSLNYEVASLLGIKKDQD